MDILKYKYLKIVLKYNIGVNKLHYIPPLVKDDMVKTWWYNLVVKIKVILFKMIANIYLSIYLFIYLFI